MIRSITGFPVEDLVIINTANIRFGFPIEEAIILAGVCDYRSFRPIRDEEDEEEL